MGKIRIHQFEIALSNLSLILRDAKNHYKSLFYAMVSGNDISKDLVTDTLGAQIVVFRKELHEKQRILSQEVLGENRILTIEELADIPELEFSININMLAQSCFRLYDELQNYMKGIELYYSSKVDEYRDFFGSIYKEMNKDARYHGQDVKGGKQSGLLVSTNA